MKKLIVAAIAFAFAAGVPAQTSSPTNDTSKAKQDTVNQVTGSSAKGAGVKAAEGSAEAAQSKKTAKALPDKKAKQDAMQGVSQSAGKGANVTAAEGSAKAAADKSPRKPPPKPSLDQPEAKKAATP